MAMKFSFSRFIVLFFVLCSFAASEECVSHTKKKRASMQRYQPTRALFCMGCQPQHKHILLVDIRATDKLRRCSLREHVTRASHLKSLRRGLKPGDIVLVTSALHHAAPTMTAMAEQLRNVSIFTYKPSAALSRTCRTLRDSCYLLDSLFPVINQIQNFGVGITEKRDASYNTYWVTESDNAQNLSAVNKQLDRLESALCKRERSRNRLIEISENQFGDSRLEEVSLSLKDLLPTDPKAYDKNRAPKISGKATVVHFHVTVLSLDSINEESMTYVADIFLAQSWRDPRLRLPGNMKEEYRILDVEWLRNIWRPDCFFKNAKKVTFHEMSIPNHYLWLYHDKTLLYMSKLTLVLSCAMKFESYPHDTQICLMMIESLSHTVQDLVFVWNVTDPLVVNPEIELPQLDISKNYTADCTIEYSTGNFTCLAVVFNLKRRLGYHLLHTYIPSALIVVMSWISFWIKPEAIPARVTLGVTSLLTLATQNTQSQQSLPPVSYVKAIDVWMSSCSVFVFLSLMEFAVVNSYMEHRTSKSTKSYSEENIQSSYRTGGISSGAFRVDAYVKESLELVNEMRSDSRLPEAERKLRHILVKAEKNGLAESDILRLSNARRLCFEWKGSVRERRSHLTMLFFGFLTVLAYLSNIHTLEGFSRFWLRYKRGSVNDHRCTIWMPDELTRIFRPPVECSMCMGITHIDKVANLTPDLFEERYAYSGRPVVITDGMVNWTAQNVFTFDFFKEIYQSRMEQWISYGCQFFPYKTEFNHLREVFNMSKERAIMLKGTDPWYVGWSNCDEEINVILRRHYDRPYFLPTTAETKRLDWIFMGSTGYGAPMHVDNVEYPSWQAQLRGRKQWNLQPPPECFYSCENVQVTVEPGEIIVLDTNRWYHSTVIVSEDISITIGAEYD